MINVNLVFLNCVLQVVYELKIADAICAGAKGGTIKGGTGEILRRENFGGDNITPGEDVSRTNSDFGVGV